MSKVSFYEKEVKRLNKQGIKDNYSDEEWKNLRDVEKANVMYKKHCKNIERILRIDEPFNKIEECLNEYKYMLENKEEGLDNKQEELRDRITRMNDYMIDVLTGVAIYGIKGDDNKKILAEKIELSNLIRNEFIELASKREP